MLSTITASRKEFLAEEETYVRRFEQLTMNGESAGSSANANIDLDSGVNGSFRLNSTEKENKRSTLGDFHILTMNSQFITSFNSGYSFPFTELREKTKRKIFKCSMFRKRRCRSHPYDNKNIKVIGENVSNSFDPNDPNDPIRLRTASLSSGTSKSRKAALDKHREHLNGDGLQRSRSMEDLKGVDGTMDKTKDIDTVSRGIQELNMEDCAA